jgi:hypothetical protein
MAARALSCDQITGEVVGALRDAGVPVILLKGPSVARWLYPAGGRSYVDSDLLVPAPASDRAEEVLRSLGFTELLAGFHPFERTRGEPAAETAFIRRVERGGPGGAVDLHRNLPGLLIPAELLWQEFIRSAQIALVGGVEVCVPGRAALALHVVLHAVQHDFHGHTDEDLRRALTVMSDDDWRPVIDLADRLGVTGILACGLRHDEVGAEVADRLGVPRLRAAMSAPKGAASFAEFWTAPAWRAKARLIRWMLFPSPAKVRYVADPSGVHRPPLLRAYTRYWRNLGRDLWPAAAAARLARDCRRLAGEDEWDLS